MLVIITGATSGIGLELVKKFKDSSFRVIAAGRDTAFLKKWIKENRVKNIMPLSADLSTEKGIKKIADEVKKTGSPVDILINNAGMFLKKPFKNITLKELQRVYTTNVFAPFLITQQLLPFISKNKGAHIVNIGSMGGVQGSAKFPGLSAYSSSKAALAGVTECLAEELKENNIRINCLALGAVQTNMLKSAFPGYKAPVSAKEMAHFIFNFATQSDKFINGKIIPVSISTP